MDAIYSATAHNRLEGLLELRFLPWTTTLVPENLRGTAVATFSQLRVIS